MQTRTLCRFALLAGLLLPPRLARSAELDVERELETPGVKLLVVDFFASWCGPCMEAVPKWEALRRKYGRQGLRLVVVAVRDDLESCQDIPWTPDAIICDTDGQVARQFGVSGLPAAFLWNWQGHMLGNRVHPEDVETKIDRWMADVPRVMVQAEKLPRSVRMKRRELERLVADELSAAGKLTVVASKADRKRLRTLAKESFGLSRSEAQECKLGQEVSANNLLEASLTRGRNKQLRLAMLSAESHCRTHAVTSPWDSRRPERSVVKAVDRLMKQLRRRRPQKPMALAAVADLRSGTSKARYESLDLPSLQRACTGGEAGACEALGRRLASSNTSVISPPKSPPREVGRVEKTPAPASRSTSPDEQACLRGNAEACSRRGWAYNKGNGVPQSYTDAARWFEKGCDLNLARSCGSLGFAYERGRGVGENMARAVELYKKACAGRAAFACSNLGILYRDGKGVTQNYFTSIGWFRKGCDLKHAKSCGDLAFAYERGRGVNKDLTQATTLYKTACEGGANFACNNLGILYRDGKGVPQSYSVSVQWFQKGCDLNHGRACGSVAFANERGRGIPKNMAQAIELYKKGCDKEAGFACHNLGILHRDGKGVTQSRTTAVKWFVKGCDLSHAGSCGDLGFAYSQGRGTTRNIARANELYQKACTGGAGFACRNLGLNYRNGNGLTKNTREAERLFRRGCDLGHDRSCKEL